MSISSVNGVASTVSRYRYVATGGETSVSGTDANGATISYLIGKEEVYLNGSLLVRGSDYQGNDGATITSLTALAASDVVEIITFVPFAIPTAISSSTVTTAGDLLVGTGAGVVNRLGVGTNGQLLQSNGTTAVWATISLAPWTSSAISSNITLVARYQYFVDTSAARTLTLPASPTQGDEIRIFDASGSAATNNITVSPGSSNLHGSVQNFVINVAYGSATLIYTGSTYGWKVA